MAKKRKAKSKRKKRLAAMQQGMVMSVFEDLDQSQKAMDGLLCAGIRPGQIWCSARGDDTGMLSSLENLDLPDQEAAFYSHACEAGHTVVIVQAADRRPEVSALLHRGGGYDFSARALQTGGHASTARADTQGEPGFKRHDTQVTAGPHKTARSSPSRSRSWKLDHFLLVFSAVQLALFGLLAWRMRKHPVFPIDRKITRVLQRLTSPFWRYLARIVGLLGGSPAIANTLAFPVAAALWKLRMRLEAAMTLGVPLTSSLARTVLKRLVDRPRPSRMHVHVYDRKHTTSFPSGDVSSSVIFWGWLFALGLMLARGKDVWQKALASTPVLFIVLSGPARIYLGVHWASDVLGAYLFGGSWLGLSLRLYLALKKRGVLDGRSSEMRGEAHPLL